MINRQLIRIKVLQILYNYYYSAGMTAAQANATLHFALDKAYQLYIYMCGLPIHFGQVAQLRLERELTKLAPNKCYVAILRALSQNELKTYMENDEEYMELYSKYALQRLDLEECFLSILGQILKAEETITLPHDFESTRSLWRHVYRTYIQPSEDFRQCLENSSPYLNEDIDIIYTFVTKAYNKLEQNKPYSSVMKPPYSDEHEERWGSDLLSNAIKHKEEYREIVKRYFKNWDPDRVSEMDYLILQLALTESIHCHDIATPVTINEYLNMARYYSSPNSPSFINGILHEAITALQAEGKILSK